MKSKNFCTTEKTKIVIMKELEKNIFLIILLSFRLQTIIFIISKMTGY